VAPLLAAIQIVPGIGQARDSVRSTALAVEDISLAGFLNWERFRQCIAFDPPLTVHAIQGTCSPFVVLPTMLASLALLRRGTRRLVLLYVLAGALAFVLAFGPNTPLFKLYLVLPLSHVFRGPERFLWITSFCLALLTAVGMDQVSSAAEQNPWALRFASVVAMTAVVAGLWLLGRGGIGSVQVALAGIAVGASILTAIRPRWHRIAGLVMLTALLLDLALLPGIHTQKLLPDTAPFFTQQDAIAALRAKMTAQDRAYFFSGGSLFAKSASLFAVPSVDDYEPVAPRRYAELFMVLRTNRRFTSVHDYHWRELFPLHLNELLLALTAARYLVVDPVGPAEEGAVKAIEEVGGVRAVPGIGGNLLVYENPRVLPRAFYVPRIEVLRDPDEVLGRLAFGVDDLRSTAFVEQPVSDFLGADGAAGPGDVTFVENAAERLELTVEAPQRGFLFVADEYADDWQATVDGRAAPIVRANYAFRLIEVPAGRSTVRFRYEPRPVRWGAWISLVTVVVLGAASLRSAQATGFRPRTLQL